jgi:DNA polymerase-3 subunit gamma/tau
VLLHRIAVAQKVPDAITDEGEKARLAPYAAAMDAESVQLAYQIVVQGCNDLALAPDEVTGFSMTLLRLLAFRPETPPALGATPRGQSAALQAPNRVARTSAPVPPLVAAAPVAASLPPEKPSPAAPTSPVDANAAPPWEDGGLRNEVPAAAAAAVMPRTNADWHALVDTLDVAALSRQLAHQSEWLASEGEVIRLRLSRDMAHLIISGQDKLRAALQTRLGVNVRLHFEQGESVGQTVAQRLNAEQRARREQACASMKNDPFVQQVIEQFGARLIEDSIKPL